MPTDLFLYFSTGVLTITSQSSIGNKLPYSVLLLISQILESHTCTMMAYNASWQMDTHELSYGLWRKSCHCVSYLSMKSHHFWSTLYRKAPAPHHWSISRRVQETQSQCGFTRQLRLPLMNMHDEAGSCCGHWSFLELNLTPTTPFPAYHLKTFFEEVWKSELFLQFYCFISLKDDKLHPHCFLFTVSPVLVLFYR